jgi:hypothetical protein
MNVSFWAGSISDRTTRNGAFADRPLGFFAIACLAWRNLERANLGSLLVQECFHLVKGAGRILPETRRLAPKPLLHIR